ncbi:MAG: diguanylate cyclase [Spirochaetales bacterium]
MEGAKSPKPKSRQIGRMLRKRYVLALSLIGGLVLFSQGMIQLSIFFQQDDSRIVNIAGRQRMLSQRINKAVFGLHASQDAELRQRYAAELQTSLDLWERSHRGLQHGDAELGLPGLNSAKITQMFAGIEGQHQAMLQAGRLALKVVAVAGYDSEALLGPLQVIQAQEQSFLKGMDALVFQYDSESKLKVDAIKYVELLVMLLTGLTLALEALFIFRPAQRQIESTLEEIENSHKNLELLFDTAPAAMFLLDGVTFRLLKLNHLAHEVLQLPGDEAAALDLSSMLSLRQGNMAELMEQLKAGMTADNLEMVLTLPGHVSLVVLMSSHLIQYQGKDTLLMGLSDITKMKEAEEVLKRFATIDEMTGLLNKRSGLQVLTNLVQRTRVEKRSLSVCFMDVDGLKSVNDAYGHEEGDFLIQSIAQVVRGAVSSQDMVFRYGGDEIVLVLGDCDRKEAEAVVLRLEQSVAIKSAEVAKPYQLHVSTGLALFGEEPDDTLEKMLTRADQAMYEQKRAHKAATR